LTSNFLDALKHLHIISDRKRPTGMAGAVQESDHMRNTTEKQERRALSIIETAQACGLSRATIYRLIEQKKLATLKVGARRLVPVGAIEALLREGA
jgi:excisionase family DNA binding protein